MLFESLMKSNILIILAKVNNKNSKDLSLLLWNSHIMQYLNSWKAIGEKMWNGDDPEGNSHAFCNSPCIPSSFFPFSVNTLSFILHSFFCLVYVVTLRTSRWNLVLCASSNRYDKSVTVLKKGDWILSGGMYTYCERQILNVVPRPPTF